ncbi:hypothetical protein AYO38_05705 [bacterium SCGC AG-212-C10]|nr:hypothetical protein AYO38_05705 [bacterium SCGC AG-212-C10]
MLYDCGEVTLGGVSPIRWFAGLSDIGDFELAQITPEIGAEAINLARLGLDPGDQLIAATAIVRKLPLVTRDERLQDLDRLEAVW